MKEAYFSPQTIQARAGEMRRQVEALVPRKALAFRPERSALLVLDMQAYFLDPGSHAYVPSAGAILPNLVALAQAYRSRRLPLFFTRHANTPQDAGTMASWWRELLGERHPLGQIAAELEPLAGDTLCKSQYDAFYATPLEQILRDRDVRQVVVSGVMAHLCCETTARSAFMRGFEVFFVVDGVASYLEAFHRAALLNLAHGFAVPVLAAEILQALEAR